MKITKHLLEEMIREELIEEGFLSWIKERAPTIAGILGVVSTLGTIGAAGYEAMERGEKEVIENSIQELNGMEPEQVEDLRSKSLNNDVMDQIWIEYDAQSELNAAPSGDSWNENKSRLERIIIQELKNVLGERFITGPTSEYASAPAGSEMTDLPPEGMEELSQLMNAPHVKKIQDEEKRRVIMNYLVDFLKDKHGV